MSEGKKSRKFGRNGRGNSHKSYTAGKRWEVNKKKRVARHAKRMEAKAQKRARWAQRQRKAADRAVRVAA